MAKQTIYKARNYRRDSELVEQTQAMGVRVENIFDDTEVKRGLLAEYGYQNLFGQGGRIPLDLCGPERVGNAFRKTYYNIKKRLARLELIDEAFLKTDLDIDLS